MTTNTLLLRQPPQQQNPKKDSWMYQAGVLAWAKRHISSNKITETTKLASNEDDVCIWWPTVLYPRWNNAALSGLMVPVTDLELEKMDSEQEAMTSPRGPKVKIALVESIRPFVTQLVHNLVPKKASIGHRNKYTNLRENVVGYYLGLHRTIGSDSQALLENYENEPHWACVPVSCVEKYCDFATVALQELERSLKMLQLQSKDVAMQMGNVRELDYISDLARALREAYAITDYNPDLLPRALMTNANIHFEVAPKKFNKAKRSLGESGNAEEDVEWFHQMETQGSQTQTQSQSQSQAELKFNVAEIESETETDAETMPFTQEPATDPDEVLTVASFTSEVSGRKRLKKVAFADGR